MKFAFVLLLIFPLKTALSQSVTSDTLGRASGITRPLPPSIIAEFRHSQKARALVFRDTISAKDIAREHFNDSDAAFSDTGTSGFEDSVISMTDTAVSLPHKEWLDSELVEIPELAKFGNRIHFNYSPAIMVETNLNAVPFDSTLLTQMNPVIIENLPFFDQSPFPMPLRPTRNSESFLEAGIGNVSVPRLTGWVSDALSERSSIDLLGQYRNYSLSSAIHTYLNLNGKLDAEIGSDPGLTAFYSNDLAIQAGFISKNVVDTNTSTNDHALSEFVAKAEFQGDLSKGFHYNACFADHELSDNYSSGASESSQFFTVGTRFTISSWFADFSGNYSHATLTADTGANANFFGSIPINAEFVKASLGKQGVTEWDAGIVYFGGNDLAGPHSALLPIAKIRLPLNARWELGAGFDPQVHLVSLQLLTEVNPFYSPVLVLQHRPGTMLPVDARSVVFDKINLSAYMNYILSPDDEIRIEARYITRDREPVFDVLTTNDSSNIFTVTSQSTTRFSFLAAGNVLLFTHDILSASAEFISSSISGKNRAIPFEPNFRFTAEYHLNSVWNNVQPTIAFKTLSRPDRTLTFLNTTILIELTKQLSGELRAENLLNGPSDFWPGYPEYPQSLWASIRYSF